jgi:hypothetical protein
MSIKVSFTNRYNPIVNKVHSVILFPRTFELTFYSKTINVLFNNEKFYAKLGGKHA